MTELFGRAESTGWNSDVEVPPVSSLPFMTTHQPFALMMHLACSGVATPICTIKLKDKEESEICIKDPAFSRSKISRNMVIWVTQNYSVLILTPSGTSSAIRMQ
jgi:hypothetical protein